MFIFDTGYETHLPSKRPSITLRNSSIFPSTNAIDAYEENKINISYQEKTLSFGDINISFARSRIKDIILRTFFTTTDLTVEKNLLLHSLYPQKMQAKMSDRYYKCLCHNTIKSISRCREKIARTSALHYPNIYWFPFDTLTHCWHLYRVIDEPTFNARDKRINTKPHFLFAPDYS